MSSKDALFVAVALTARANVWIVASDLRASMDQELTDGFAYGRSVE
jgi:hypothetical protein